MEDPEGDSLPLGYPGGVGRPQAKADIGSVIREDECVVVTVPEEETIINYCYVNPRNI